MPRRLSKKRLAWAAQGLVLFLAFGVALAQGALPRSAPWIGLASGQRDEYQWSVEVHARGNAGDAGRPSGLRPCVSVSALWRLGRYSYRKTKDRQCAGTSRPLNPTHAPLIASAAQPSDGHAVKISAVGMIFAPAVRRVEITLAGGERKSVPLDQMSAVQAHEAGLRRLRYAAFTVHGLWCAERLVSKDATGKTLWDSDTDQYTCGSG